jgi:PAS domain S-box-containing protein
MFRFLKDLKLNIKISILGAGSVLITAGALVALAVWQSGQYNELAQSEVDRLLDADLDHIAEGAYNLVRTEDEAVKEQLSRNLSVMRYILAAGGGADLSRETVEWTAVNQFTGQSATMRLPRMLVGGRWIGQNSQPAVMTPVVDEVERLVGETATIFQRINERGDMLRVATNVRDSRGRRAIGTYIPAIDADGSPNPVIAAVLQGKTYHGRAFVVNAWYLTAYEPLRDLAGGLVGMIYVGIKQKSVEMRIRHAIQQIKVGKTGYVYVLGGKGEDRGRYIISWKGERDDENIWDSTDSDGRYVAQEIIRKATVLKPGEMATERYRWQNPGETEPRWKVARLTYYAPWDWVIGVGVHEDELHSYRAILSGGRNRMTGVMGAAGIAITLLIGLLGVLIAWTITRHIRQMTRAAETIILGDLSQMVDAGSRDEVGTLARTFNMMTERLRETMAGLSLSERKYREIFENAVEGLFQTDLEGRILSASPSMARILGYDSPGHLMASVSDLRSQFSLDGGDPDNVLDAVLKRGEIVGHECRCGRGDGQRIWVSLSARIGRGEEGTSAFLEGFLVDISDRKRAEEEMRLSEGKYRSIFENSVEGIFRSTPEGRFLSINPAGVRMFGYGSQQEMIDSVVDIAQELYVDPGDREKRKELLGSRGVVEGFEVEMRRKDGTRIWVSINSRVVRDAAGKVLYYDNTAEDITERRRLEARVRQSQKMEAIGTLAGGVAHDFNNILSVLMGYASLLQLELNEDDPLQEYVEHIMTSSQKAVNLTASLLTFGRLQPVRLSPVDLNETIRGTQKLLERLITEDIKLKACLGAGDLVVMADTTQIDQILFNLASNARDAMPKGGTLTIKTELVKLDGDFVAAHGLGEPGEYALLSVSDNGSGMDEHVKEQIFDPFFTTKETGKGTGLGLSTVYGIVKRHGGYINVYSEKGMGTTFHIYLPAVSAAVEQEVLSAPQVSGGTETVLVADDDADVRRLIRDVLTKHGYTVLEAVDGEDVVEKFRQIEKVDLVVIDSVMPGKNGREAYEAITRITPGMKVIFMSGYTRDVILEKGIEEGEFDFLSKPLGSGMLLKMVREVLDRA